jgi:hypothetical protein
VAGPRERPSCLGAAATGHTAFASRDWQQLAAAAGLKLVLPPPDAGDVARAERVVGSRLSASLADLYRHADGVVDQWGYAYVLPIAEMREQNETFRSSFGDLYT